ncbi:hypothetical protein I203_101982 [Kwoniella mangroviensis CBS 8507]|uniref:uncharacterized protein n=1 Tax=Kwoniella mangroviensis CBS 8507 TaxID=1296122 RepID=UPI00080D3DF8|nr:uncharacterized protein I203_03176 [Kwoniella mangroviensis CBS 8507]OCF67481.1 hypothetical protein I203_03176 [Kwoniella mangroviensis CBS 8507]
MPPRAGPSRPQSRPKGRPSFIPSTQFQAGPSDSRARSDREESEDPLALSPIKVTPTITRTRRSTRSSNLRSSSPASVTGGLSSSTQRVTRGSKRRDREYEELELGEEDLVPPSEDEEYEEWKESRRARTDEGEGKEVVLGIDREAGMEEEEEDMAKGLRRPKKPDKRLDHNRTFESLLPSPSPPSPTPSISSSITDARSRETSPTQPLSFSQQDDPFYTVYEDERLTLDEDARARWEHDELDLSSEVPRSESLDRPLEEVAKQIDEGKYRSVISQAVSNLPLRYDINKDGVEAETVDESSAIARNDNATPNEESSDHSTRSRTTTPHTVPMLPTRDEGFETLLPDDRVIDESDSSVDQEGLASMVVDEDLPAKQSSQISRSSTPRTLPFMPDQDQAFETVLPAIGLDHEDLSIRAHRPPTPQTSTDLVDHSMISPLRAHSPTPRSSARDPNDENPFTPDEVLVSPSKQPTLFRQSSPAKSLSPIFAAVAELPDNPPSSCIPHLPAPSPPPADPALAQFRGARTFRTRTVLQLQPYTKERQIYEAALRKGGLKKGKKAIAPSKEITQEEAEEDEARVSESSEASAEDESPERIVIGNTPPLNKPREPKKLVDADFDEYFFEHGTAADENDLDHMKDLQKIARRRLKAEKEERKRLRADEKEKREFARLMKEMRGEKEDSDEQHEDGGGQQNGKSRISLPRPAVRTIRTPAGIKTYGNKGRTQRAAVQRPSSDSDEDAQPSTRPPLISPSKSQGNTPTASYRTAFSGFNDADMDVGYGQPQDDSDPAIDAATSHSPLERQNSFFIDDLARSPSRPRASFGSESDSASSSASTVHDRRQKIARRMMPAAMLRRLEAEAAAREHRKAENKKKQQAATESPIRPGRAVVRRGGGQVNMNGLEGLFDEEDPDDILEQTPTPSFSRYIPNSSDQPIVISDGGSSSEAEEDNQAEQTLARLHRGDFESIVSGKRWKSAVKTNHQAQSRPKARSSHSRRPALGLAKRVRAPISENNRAMVQKRLDFPVMDKSPVSSLKKKRKRSFHQGKQQRPAIRLDDHVIFATADFEFDEEDDTPTRPSTKEKLQTIPRHFARTTSANLKQSKSLDADMGKARSWANFDKFPIDFDITPLPSGLHCIANSIPGSGKLDRLVREIRGNKDEEMIDSCLDYGIELRQDMSPSSIQAVAPLLFDAVHRRMVVIANQDDAEELELECFRFLGRYVRHHHHDIDENVTLLKTEIEDAIGQLEGKLEDIDIGRAKQGREALLNLRWALVELSCRLEIDNSSSTGEAHMSLLQRASVKLFHHLLSHGFDKTIRPLKQIMRGESDSAEIKDLTVTLWISLIHVLIAWDERECRSSNDTFLTYLTQAFDSVFNLDQTGPIAAERVWFLVFGLCALTQFDADGRIISVFVTSPRWSLVRRAVGLIKVAFDEDAEKRAHLDQLQGRDRYIKVVMARCVRLSAVWKWSFDRESFSVATRDLGIIFKDRQYRNLPTEPSVDYPEFITRFDMSLTAADDTKRETAFELYLRLVCVAASDIISAAQTLSEAQQAEKDVQRLVMSIIPVSSVKFNRIFPPSPKDLGQLINRYSTMIASCYFSPSLLTYLLANSKKWSAFEEADFDSRQICIRGLMYLSVARRHHKQPLQPVVNRLAELMGILQNELEILTGPSNQTLGVGPTKLEIERTMVLIVSCFRQMIKHHSFDVEEQKKAVYPDPCLLHESWTVRIFDLELAKDLKCGLEVIATIQSFLDTRTAALPKLAKQRREAKESHSESFDEFGSLGIDFTDADVLALGGELGEEENEVEKQDEEFARIIEEVISPKIYRLLSDMLPPVPDDDARIEHDADQQVFISKLTKCWSDCASVLVVEHQQLDWSTFISPFGRQSWARLGDERGRVQVGLHFMLNVAQSDPAAFSHHEEDFIALLFQVIGTDKLTVEHHYLSALLAMPGAYNHPLLAPFGSIKSLEGELSRDGFMGVREVALRSIFSALPDLLKSSKTPASTKSFIYRCINLFVSSIISYDQSIKPNKVIHKESYRAFTDTIIRDVRKFAGEYINPLSVPGLKHFDS